MKKIKTATVDVRKRTLKIVEYKPPHTFLGAVKKVVGNMMGRN
ncbi:MAG: hypothetical protein ACPF80_01555 [Flavobacteriaceae bacterium]